MDHVHTHGGGPSDAPVTSQRMRAVLASSVLLIAIAALVGAVVLWPDGRSEGFADELGMKLELVDATVTAVEEVACRGTEEAAGIRCLQVSFDVTSGRPEGDRSSFEVPVTEVSVDIDEGDGVVLTYQPQNEPGLEYFFSDFQRRTPMLWLTGLFVLAVVALGRLHGLRALAGLGLTGVVVVGFLFPAVLDGKDPTAVALVAAAGIGIVALYLTHGVSERTTVALLGTFVALALTAVLGAVFSSAAHFTGYATEDAFYLRIASADIDIAGLVLAGIIIGSLGVLDDVTVTQVSAVWQLHEANPTYGIRRLYRAGLAIGRDHIASTVNTLVLAYAGASLPLLLYFTQVGRSLSDVAVGELVAVEIVRTLVGSIGLVAAVPATTALAAWVVARGSMLAPSASMPAPAPAPDPATRRRGAEDPAASDGPDPDTEPRWEQFGPQRAEDW